MKISAYTTVKNVVEQNYPCEQSIKSLFDIVDEIIVCDTSDKNDGTKEILEKLKTEFCGEFKIVTNPNCDWSRADHGRFDGENKAFAKKHCTGDYCIQIDSDEILIATRKQIENIINKIQLSEEYPVLALPVIEPWGSNGFNRIDVNIWKWRIYKNYPWLTHGIPASHKIIKGHEVFAKPGCDGCEPLDSRNGQMVNTIHFTKPEYDELRRKAIFDFNAALEYENWINKTTDKLPYILHLSWWSVYEKMLKYKNFWSKSWGSLYDQKQEEGYNPFIKKSFNELTNEEMIAIANIIEEKCCGFIFHNQIDLNNIPKTNGFKLNKQIPYLVKDWCEKNKTPKV